MDLFDKLGSILPFLIFALITILGNLGDKKKPKVKMKTKPFPKGQKLPENNRIVITNNDLKRFCSFHCFSLASMLHVLRNASGTPALPKHPSAPQCSTNPRRKQTESF